MSRRRLVSGLLLGALLAGCGDEPAPQAFPDAHLIVISLDTLRADGLGTQGGPQGVSPSLDAFAREAVVFEHARSAAPHTAPSHMSLFTSLYPSVHGVQNVAHADDPRTPEVKKVPIIYELPEDILTLADVLRSRDFTTIGMTDGGNINPAHGFYRGFQVYTKDLKGVDAQIDDAVAWLEDRRAPEGDEASTQIVNGLGDVSFSDRPAGRFFLFWHTYEVHAPYVPPEEYVADWAPADYDGPLRPVVDDLAGLSFKEKWGRMKVQFWRDRDRYGDEEARFLRGLYDGGVRYTDDELPRLFEALKQQGLWDTSIIVVTSDHGEEFREHGLWQHEQLYEECLRVPLMIRMPGGLHGGTRLSTPVSLMDVMPTVLELLGVDEQTREGLAMQGTSLARAVLWGTEPLPRQITSELRWDRPGNPNHDWLVSHYYQGKKLIYDEIRGQRVDGQVVQRRELFDLEADPDERQDLAPQGGVVLERLMDLHERWKMGVDARTKGLEMLDGEIDCDAIDELAELGYIDGESADRLRAECEEGEG